ncbi:hypothetical protein EYY93_00750 [Hafnia paralvei]|nr:hypothetical protein A6J69_006025 [Hafnia paralvei]TBM06936.1 hypothetical protein EYY93_00750 [Hafnia paralvei]
MAIAVRSVKARMTTFGYLRSRLKDGAKLGCWGAAIGPPTRTPARCACRFQSIRRTKSFTFITLGIRLTWANTLTPHTPSSS